MEYSFKMKHSIDFDKTKVSTKTTIIYPRQVRETIKTVKRNNFNKEDIPKLLNTVPSKLLYFSIFFKKFNYYSLFLKIF